MGVKDRRRREQVGIRRSILDAARTLFVAKGYVSVPIRDIAHRIEYSPGTIYRYFDDKDDVFFALAEEGWGLLSETVQAGDDHRRAPLDRLRTIFWTFYQFSKTHPEYYYLMFIDRAVPRINKEFSRFHVIGDLVTLIVTVIRRAESCGDLPKGLDPLTVFDVLWSSVHGLAVSRVCNRQREGLDADHAVNTTLDVVMAGLRHVGASTPGLRRRHRTRPDPTREQRGAAHARSRKVRSH